LSEHLRQFDAQHAANSARGAAQRVERDRCHVGIEQPVELPAAGLHARRHGALGQALLLHGLGELLGNDFLDGVVYPSVRKFDRTCLVCFRPALVTNVRKGSAYVFQWEGKPEPTVTARA
jgi:hypothetical protein